MKSINQVDFVLSELNNKIENMLKRPEEESEFIKDITDIAYNNRNIAKEISMWLISRHRSEYINMYKVKTFFILDSIIKTIGKEYITQLSPFIYDLFENTFTNAENEDKIKLFKLYYSWKYILDPRISERIRVRFHLDEIKEYLMRTQPDVIKRYDRYNEMTKEKLNITIGANIDGKNIIGVNTTSNVTPSHPNVIHGHIQHDVINQRQTHIANPSKQAPSLFNSTDNISTSFLKKIKAEETSKVKERGGLSDDLFSESSPANDEFSDDDVSENDSSSKSKGRNTNAVDFGKTFSKDLKKIQIKKKAHIDKLKPSIDKKNMKYIPDRAAGGNQLIDSTLSNNRIMIDNIKDLLKNPNVKILSEFVKGLQDQTAMSGLNSNLINKLTKTNISTPQDKPGVLLQNKTSHNISSNFSTIQGPGTSVIHSLSAYLKKYSGRLNEKMQLFSSITKYFNDVSQEGNILKEIIKENKNLKSRVDIITHFKDFNMNETSKELQKKIFTSLFTDVKNICAVCGYRTKIYAKYIEHIDIHFYINFLRRDKKKVLCRRESMTKQSWITNSTYATQKNSGSYTLNAVLYYQNEAEGVSINSKVNKAEEIQEDSEGLIYPVQYEDEVKCIYCYEAFKRKYISKFNYWFYVNAIKVEEEEMRNYRLTHKEPQQTFLIHETCIEEFLKKVKVIEGNDYNFINQKTRREEIK